MERRCDRLAGQSKMTRCGHQPGRNSALQQAPDLILANPQCWGGNASGLNLLTSELTAPRLATGRPARTSPSFRQRDAQSATDCAAS
jgi:hypothetical protein